jgi:hypothetical protein
MFAMTMFRGSEGWAILDMHAGYLAFLHECFVRMMTVAMPSIPSRVSQLRAIREAG